PWERTLAVPLAARKLVLANTIPPGRWRVTGKSWRGAAHIESGKENQDAIQYVTNDDGLVALAVADGHGSGMCFRSQVGSRLAVQAAVRCLCEFAETHHADEQATTIADRARTHLVSELTDSWRTAVSAHLAETPFSPDDVASVVAQEGWMGQQALQHHPESA